ncbi:SirB2 family protein [Pontibacter sp. E15-1]|uniref:SirB2 family protein n=1 Tax=Pontibacter sp. E15-1 TaxID=2919918 RepID=UPI001F4FF8A8|nr:SirB2 family protein [Pontibacter sp. E15-1]MCJ8165483.1 SirB2 family protein [Pontibacter sp. E15-1]
MPPIAFLHTHVLVVVLFLLLFTVKAVLLFLNKREALNSVRSKTKVLDMVFGTLILLTGGYLLFLYNGGTPTWLIVKIVLVLAAIPLGIVGIKRENKALTGLSLFIFLYVYGVAETKSLAMHKDKPADHLSTVTPAADAVETGDASLNNPTDSAPEEIVAALSETQLANTKAIYTQVCANCHGSDGAKGMGGATNLKESNLSLNDRMIVIEKGRGLMPGFGDKLTRQETEALAAYTTTLKQSN